MAREPVPDWSTARADRGDDEGLAPERTQLAWGRTGLALLLAVGVIARKVWSLTGPVEVAAMVMVGVGAVSWAVGMRLSRRLHPEMAPRGLDGGRAFALVTAGTLVFAVGGLVFAVVEFH